MSTNLQLQIQIQIQFHNHKQNLVREFPMQITLIVSYLTYEADNNMQDLPQVHNSKVQPNKQVQRDLFLKSLMCIRLNLDHLDGVQPTLFPMVQLMFHIDFNQQTPKM